MNKTVHLNLQEEVPEHVLRTVDYFSSDSEDEGNESESGEIPMKMEDGEELETEENPQWANAMANILKTNIPEGKKSVILAKAKHNGSKKKKTNNDSNNSLSVSGELKEEKPKRKLETIKFVKNTKQQEWRQLARIKPSASENLRERALLKIATKGVVQLFNTVNDHHKKLKRDLEKAGLEGKKDKVVQSFDKQGFLDMLTNPKAKNTRSNISRKVEKKEEETPWKVLREDFIMGGTLKDWDKTIDESNLQTLKAKDFNIVDGDSDVDSHNEEGCEGS